jgi:hypothetical protein
MSASNEKRGLSPEKIKELQAAGFHVFEAVDQEPVLYAWLNVHHDASQSQYRDRQPYRRTRAQAWADCYAFYRGNMPMTPEPDWSQEPAAP